MVFTLAEENRHAAARACAQSIMDAAYLVTLALEGLAATDAISCISDRTDYIAALEHLAAAHHRLIAVGERIIAVEKSRGDE